MKTYSFLTNHLFIDGVEVTDWAPGDDVFKGARRTDSATDVVGADGKMTVSINANRTGEITIKIKQTSPMNAYLMGRLVAMEGGPLSFVPVNLMWQDTYRQDRGVGSRGYVRKVADVQRGENQNDQEWSIIVERWDLLLGNPTFPGSPTAIAEGQ